MRPLKRLPTNKHRSVKKFRRQARRTKARNMTAPMRGGLRI